MKAAIFVVGLVVLWLAVGPVGANPVFVVGIEGPQDHRTVNGWVEELGFGPSMGGPFDPDEEITVGHISEGPTACFDGSDDPGIWNALIAIGNNTNRTFSGLYYVADPETTISNFDCFINGEPAFRIDNVGINRPLYAEVGGTVNGLFEPGEAWWFILQDYQNALGLAPNLFGSLGVGNGSGGDLVSSGSIITPEPATLALLALGGLGVAGRLLRRRR